MKRVLVFASIIGTVVLFQNCQGANYTASSSQQSSLKPGELGEVVSNDPEDATGEIEQPATPVDDDNQDPGTNPPGKDKNKDKSADGQNVCILAGPGKSVKLGMGSDGTMHGQNPVPEVLCMSANACLNIASQIFDVKGSYFRGYCKSNGNPHVSHITDAELKAKVNAILAAP